MNQEQHLEDKKSNNKICYYGWQCRDKQACQSMHPGEKGFDYLLQQVKLKLLKVCPLGETCKQKGWCAYLHPGDKVNKMCCNPTCQKPDCYYLHKSQFDVTQEQMQIMNLTQEEKNFKAQQTKDRGNTLFKDGQYQEAIEQYSLAIELIPQDSVFFSNRAQCWKKLFKWEKVMLDSEQAVEYDANNLRAKNLLLISICELAKNSQVSEIVQILNDQLQMVKNIEQMGQQLKKQQFTDLKTTTKKIEELKNLKEHEMEMLNKYMFINTIRTVISRSSLPHRQIDKLVIMMANLDQKQQMQEECPEYLQCNISFELFNQPFLTPQGITFEKECLDQHFQKNGRNDPITRTPIQQKILFNQSIYDGVQHYKKTIQHHEENVFTLPIIHQLMQGIHFE